ncbi:M23 family metallopeptidase [Pontibacillus litoralis]|uniref:M23ase beta-sheet core domain-containing protein n=1 Tax=Pontibacillus litoralis JSM 072002 TaxID=1385512 RepID=A0A0A5HV75_9BACI|nr:M23 family metallopeptidase [Pontibacillus litoralis]KGX87502.1 hypothetical protein N784_14750 [Pontibacillus litoralis JSM 072002]
MKLHVKEALALLLTFSLVGCGESNNLTSNQTNNHKTQVEELVSVEQFPKQFLAGEFEAIYNQTSEPFQEQVSFEQFEELAIGFNKGVKNYTLLSKLPIQNVTEYVWISDGGDKGIRSYFGKKQSIEGLQLVPLNTYATDNVFTQNTYQMPITGEWFTFWGGTNELVNYHYALESQRYAYDLVIYEGDSTFEGDPKKNESYYAFGKDIVAPRKGVVISVKNDITDNTPTVNTNAEQPLGNHVIIEHQHKEYSIIAHMQKGSVQVREGDQINAGDVLGNVGNSGNSSEPHVHFQISNGSDWKEATSLRIKLKDEANPIRGDIVTGF